MIKNTAETRGLLNSGSLTRSLSTGSHDNGDNARRNPSDFANVNQRKIPNYLRPSSGSCHDICKYGRRHASEDSKPNIPLRKRRLAKPSSNEDTFIEILVPGEQKKENVDGKKHSLKPSPNAPRPNAALPQDSIDDKQVSRTDQKTIDQPLKHPSSVKSKPAKVKSSDGVQTGGKARASVPANKSAAPKSSLGRTTSNKARQSGKVKSSFPGKDQHRVETEASDSHVSEKTLHVIEIDTEKNPLESTPENQSLSQINSSMANEGNGTDEFAPDNQTLTRETGSTLDGRGTPPLPPPSSSKSSFHRRTPTSSSSASSSTKPSPHRRSSSSSSSSKTSSHRRSPSSSSSKYSYHSTSPSMSFLDSDEEINNIGKESDELVSGKRTTVKVSKGSTHHSKNQRKIRVVNADDKYNRLVKLKFKSGTIVDLHQDNNNNIPRRLTFRRMRIEGNKAEMSVSHNKKSLEIGNVQSVKEYSSNFLSKNRVVVSEYKQRRSPLTRFLGGEKGINGSSLQGTNTMAFRLKFRRGRTIGADEGKYYLKRSIKTSGGGGGVEDANLKMKLKHRDLKGKKDDQCLFNNVIEETATKLAESRKSKVKALVGAFETVISLQDHKRDISPRARET